ncbi:putative acetyltransferase [Marinomonas sp. MED121]|uniref:GNAT family N-acetyltransferase n=1 Tax=Marinomonas sp. MED121 TaxID=314277 RepID=UPI00006910AD|nr:GNAT family N-acetyltransferase [Marinomonas sp. MED121]EAQ67122.1 putative acetyltransferase [Marinomonas sp. MED121]
MEDLNFVDKSDFMFHRVSGKVTFKDNYFDICTESNPDFIWGNYYAFLTPTAIKKHNQRLESISLAKRGFFAFSYNTDHKDLNLINEYQAKGFSVDIDEGMIRTESMIEIKNENLSLGIVSTDEEWQEVIHNQLKNSGLAKEETGFLEKRFVDYRKMLDKGQGHWFFAKKDGQILGDLGIFFDGDNARFQQVGTVKEARNQGVCQSLVCFAGNYCLNKLRMKSLVIVADEGSQAQYIYQKLGFKTVLYTHSFLKNK